MRRWLFLATLGLSCALPAVEPANAQTYTITDLGILPGYQFVNPLGVSESGQVTGSVLTYFSPLSAPGVPVNQAFLFKDGKMVAIAEPFSTGYGIVGDDRKGPWPEDEERRKLRITGEAQFSQHQSHAFLYEDHLLRDLGLLPGGTYSAGYALNSHGEVVGEADDAEGEYVAFLYKHGNMISLGTLKGDTGSTAYGINNFGDVTGVSDAVDFDNRAFLYHDGKMFDLGTLPGSDVSIGTAINDHLEITGTANSINFEFQHAFLWRKGKMIDLGTLPNHSTSQAAAINSWGQVVGSVDYGDGFIYTNGKMYDLNNMIPANSGWGLGPATGINDRGQITGSGSLNGLPHGYLLTPDCKDSKNKDCDFCRDYQW